jgi:hypothetical protein
MGRTGNYQDSTVVINLLNLEEAAQVLCVLDAVPERSLPGSLRMVSAHGVGKNWCAYCGGYLQVIFHSVVSFTNKIIRSKDFNF